MVKTVQNAICLNRKALLLQKNVRPSTMILLSIRRVGIEMGMGIENVAPPYHFAFRLFNSTPIPIPINRVSEQTQMETGYNYLKYHYSENYLLTSGDWLFCRRIFEAFANLQPAKVPVPSLDRLKNFISFTVVIF